MFVDKGDYEGRRIYSKKENKNTQLFSTSYTETLELGSNRKVSIILKLFKSAPQIPNVKWELIKTYKKLESAVGFL